MSNVSKIPSKEAIGLTLELIFKSVSENRQKPMAQKDVAAAAGMTAASFSRTVHGHRHLEFAEAVGIVSFINDPKISLQTIQAIAQRLDADGTVKRFLAARKVVDDFRKTEIHLPELTVKS